MMLCHTNLAWVEASFSYLPMMYKLLGVFALTPHTSPWGTCIYQESVPNFDPEFPGWLRIPTWISLVKLTQEFKPVEGYIALALGPIYAADPLNGTLRDPRFCVDIDASQEWPSGLCIKGMEGVINSILISYEHVPMRCKFCMSLNHRVADCGELKSNRVNQQIKNGVNRVNRVNEQIKNGVNQQIKGGLKMESINRSRMESIDRSKMESISRSRVDQEWSQSADQG
ncbi:hypothetical protein M758_UG052700 [Ceratodon purpureus]|nr:hypothetical protein M758_UG052700 [Ceratodon purpureus]